MQTALAGQEMIDEIERSVALLLLKREEIPYDSRISSLLTGEINGFCIVLKYHLCAYKTDFSFTIPWALEIRKIKGDPKIFSSIE